MCVCNLLFAPCSLQIAKVHLRFNTLSTSVLMKVVIYRSRQQLTELGGWVCSSSWNQPALWCQGQSYTAFTLMASAQKLSPEVNNTCNLQCYYSECFYMYIYIYIYIWLKQNYDIFLLFWFTFYYSSTIICTKPANRGIQIALNNLSDD